MVEFKIPTSIAKVMSVAGGSSFDMTLAHGVEYDGAVANFIVVSEGGVLNHKLNTTVFDMEAVRKELC